MRLPAAVCLLNKRTRVMGRPPAPAAWLPQVELRVLAHLSGDQRLVGILRQAGAAGDAFQLIARNWLGSGARDLRWPQLLGFLAAHGSFFSVPMSLTPLLLLLQAAAAQR